MPTAPRQPNLVQSLKETRDVAVFFDKLFHSLKSSDRRQGRDLVAAARKGRLAIPSALEGYRITYATRHTFSDQERRRMVVVELPPRPGEPDTAALTFNGCASFTNKSGGITIKGKVCISCTISLKGASCTVTITATVSV